MIDCLMELRKRRSHYHLIGEILSLAAEGASKTRIMYRANLSATMTKEYIELLQQKSLIKVSTENGRNIYITNERGFQYLQGYRGILRLLSPENENGVELNIKGGPFTYWVEKTPPANTA
jgi:predicted transcriptional regulator